MGQRGKKSQAELSVVRSGTVSAIERPEPPAELTDEQAGVWLSIVNSLPADWIDPPSLPALGQYCRHVVAANKVARMIDDMESGQFDVMDYDRLMRMQERESKTIAAIGTKLRLFPQNTRSAGKTKGRAFTIPSAFDG